MRSWGGGNSAAEPKNQCQFTDFENRDALNLPVTRRSKSRIEHCSLVPLSSLCPTRDREASVFAAFAMAGVPSEDEITYIFIPVGDDFFLTFDPFHIFSSSEESSD